MFAARKTDGAATATAANYIEDVFSTYLYTGNGSVQTIPNGIAIGDDYGGSVFFDGTGDNLSVADNTAFTLPANFTIECWIYPTAGAADRLIISKWGGTAEYYIFTQANNVIGFAWGPFSASGLFGGALLLSGNNAFALNTWSHVAVVRNSNTFTLYVNGTSVATATNSAAVTDGAEPVTIGDYGGGGFGFAGYISNARIVKGTAVYTANFTPSATPLTAISGTSLLTCQTPNTVLDYSSNAFTITVTNAIAQNGGGPFTDSTANKGGMVWLKSRSAATDHALYDTNRGATFDIGSNLDIGQTTQTTGLTAFNSNGFSIGALAKLNTSAATYTSWTFRKQAKFFDVVTYTGTGAARTVSHNLGSVPGCIIIKRTNSTSDWRVYHRSMANTEYLALNSTIAKANSATIWNSTTPTATEFSLGSDTPVNATANSYVAYLFAHDAGGFGEAGADNVISCGSYTGNGSATGPTVTLGYEPQWILIKNASGTASNWVLYDSMRGIPVGTGDKYLIPNATTAETDSSAIDLTPTGFNITASSATWNASGVTYIYIAIRRGPMKTPTSGTSVLGLNARNGTGANATVTGGAGVTDLAIIKNRTGAFGALWVPRLAGTGYLLSSATTAETAAITTFLQANPWDVMDGVKVGTTSNTTNDSGATYINYLFDRAPGFFDVVCYSNAGSPTTVAHNLGVEPELIITKRRNGAYDWIVYSKTLGATKVLFLNTTDAQVTFTCFANVGATSFQTFSPANDGTQVAYLFATLAGISKVGSYTGTGATLQIDCGFTAGARFVMIKRTDNTGNWFYWDTARGIVSGNDPYLLMNTTAIETTSTDYVDPYSAGFEISNNAVINASGATYIYLAIA